ncbi:MAG: DNA replication and repair protein RecF, partial [Lachnospiraceae bacterium]|nr:DNA replication and repair protein RecF [Lachnospiraceae bacterium]
VRQKIHDTPVLLLDDVLSELDAGRQERLLAGLGGTQTLITCTGLDEFVKGSHGVDKRFRVTEGTISEEEVNE